MIRNQTEPARGVKERTCNAAQLSPNWGAYPCGSRASFRRVGLTRRRAWEDEKVPRTGKGLPGKAPAAMNGPSARSPTISELLVPKDKSPSRADVTRTTSVLPDGIRCKASSAALGDLIPEEHFEQAEGVEFIFPTIE